jgi:hypothetical protein
MSERAIGGSSLAVSDRPSRSFGKGRKCKEDGCDTRLSIYNQGRYCYLHEPMAVPRTRGRKIA